MIDLTRDPEKPSFSSRSATGRNPAAVSTPEPPREHTPGPSLQPRKSGKRVTEKTAFQTNVTYSWCAASETKSRTGFIRYYNPVDGRWINRDPMWEQGGVNLFAVCNNNAISQYDLLGMNVLSSITVVFFYTDNPNPTHGGDADWDTTDPKTGIITHHHKDGSGLRFRGTMTTNGDPESVEYDIQSGGRVEPKSAVKKPGDTSTPSGTYQVNTVSSGSVGGYLLVGVPDRSVIEIHAGNISTGCITVEDGNSWEQFKKDMCETKAAKHDTIPITVSYRMGDGQPLPKGNRGPGKNDNGGTPPPPDQMGPPSPKWPGWND